MYTHTQEKPNTDNRPFHPGRNRKAEAIYLAYDAASINPSVPEKHMPLQATATILTISLVIVEMLLFFWLFGTTGLLFFIISTLIYTLIDKRARNWLRGLLKNNSDGSAG